MEQTLFDFALQIPQTLASFGNWLITPISPQFLNISPLGLLGVGGVGFIISIIAIHVVRLFTP